MEALIEFFVFVVTKLTEVPGFSGSFLLFLGVGAYIGIQLIRTITATDFGTQYEDEGDIPLVTVLVMYQLILLAATMAVLGGFILFLPQGIAPIFSHSVAGAGLLCIMKTSTIAHRVKWFMRLGSYDEYVYRGFAPN